MKTIFTTFAIATSAILFGQQSAPSVEWTQNYNVNNTNYYGVTLDNNNNLTLIAKDQIYNSETGEAIEKMHLVKVGSGGVMSDVILSVPEENYYPYKLVQTSDNAYLTTNENNGTLQKYTSTGALAWNKTFGSDFFTDDFVKTNDNNLMVIGANFDDNDFYYMFRKMDNNGNTIWEKKAEKLNGMYYEPTTMAQTSDGGFFVAGVYTDDLDAEYTLGTNLVKLDANGNVIWEKRLAIPVNAEVWPQQLLLANDGGIIILSEYDDDSGSTNYNSQYAKYDSTGTLLWSKATTDYVSSIQKGMDNGYVLSVTPENTDPSLDPFFLRKIDEFNNLVWEKDFGVLGYSHIMNMLKTNNGFIAVTNFFNQDQQVGSVKITKFGTAIVGTSDMAKQNITLYPNPTVDFLNLKIENVKSIDEIEIYDVSGRVVKSIANASANNIDVKDLKKGSYVVKVQSGDHSFASKFIKK